LTVAENTSFPREKDHSARPHLLAKWFSPGFTTTWPKTKMAWPSGRQSLNDFAALTYVGSHRPLGQSCGAAWSSSTADSETSLTFLARIGSQISLVNIARACITPSCPIPQGISPKEPTASEAVAPLLGAIAEVSAQILANPFPPGVRGIPGAELVELEKTEHGLLIESPDAVSTTLLDFLKKSVAGRRAAGDHLPKWRDSR
jgi:hypothetical protein